MKTTPPPKKEICDVDEIGKAKKTEKNIPQAYVSHPSV
jgi:hypothetical protein